MPNLKEDDNALREVLTQATFPVPICDNIRIFNVKLIRAQEYRAEPKTLCLRVT